MEPSGLTWADLTGPVSALILLIIGSYSLYRGWIIPKPTHDEIVDRQAQLFSATAKDIGESIGKTVIEGRAEAVAKAVEKGIEQGLPIAYRKMVEYDNGRPARKRATRKRK